MSTPSLSWTLMIVVSVSGGPDAEVPDPRVGGSHLVAGSWFQYLGASVDGETLWLYPHVDGVHEVFAAGDDPGGAWEGLLGSRYDPVQGTFIDRFNAAEVVNEVLSRETPLERRREAERLLLVFAELHDGGEPPFYADSEVRRLRRQLPRDELAWIERRVEAHRAALARVARPGTLVPSLATPLPLVDGPQEYYRRLVRDGYLDVALVGGNLRNRDTGAYHSWTTLEEVRRRLDELGFSRARFRRAADAVISEKVTRIRDATIRVRVVVTGGSLRAHRIRRAAANFAEGLAHADVVLYHGHSNSESGAYYTSESRSRLSRFRIGRGATRDLEEKCHGLGTKKYQILALLSCSSYEKYCRPLRWYLQESAVGYCCRGLIGNADTADAADFAPRFGEFLALLLQERGARDIAERLGGIRPSAITSPLVLRGVLQPSFTFVVPEGVGISGYEELVGRRVGWVVGTGTDGRRYASSDTFPQDRPGEVVQVLECSPGLLGLYDDGRLWISERGGGGTARETRLSREGGLRLRFVGLAPLHGSMRVFLLSEDGLLRVLNERSCEVEDVSPRPPEGLEFRALGAAAEGALLLEDTTGSWFRWDPGRRELEPVEGPPEGSVVVPSLLDAGGPARLWTPEGVLDPPVRSGPEAAPTPSA